MSEWREEEKRNKRFYRLSASGEDILQQLVIEWRDLNSALDEMLEGACMDLLERHLQAVRFWLPKAQKQDIKAELSEAIRSQMEEREQSLNRKLDRSEIEAILKSWGPPLLVAERYLPQQYLIGPKLYPIYRLLLRSAFLYYLIPMILVWAVLVSLGVDPGWTDPGRAIATLLSRLWVSSVYGFAGITLAFLLIEKYTAGARFLDDWQPGKLPALRHPNRFPRSCSSGELAGNVVSLLWWMGFLHLPIVPELGITPTAVWQTFYLPVLFLLIGSTLIGAIDVVKPHWTRRRSYARLMVNVFGVLLSALLLAGGLWVAIENADVSRWANLSIQITILGCAITYAWLAIADLRRLSAASALISAPGNSALQA